MSKVSGGKEQASFLQRLRRNSSIPFQCVQCKKIYYKIHISECMLYRLNNHYFCQDMCLYLWLYVQYYAYQTKFYKNSIIYNDFEKNGYFV